MHCLIVQVASCCRVIVLEPEASDWSKGMKHVLRPRLRSELLLRWLHKDEIDFCPGLVDGVIWNGPAHVVLLEHELSKVLAGIGASDRPHLNPNIVHRQEVVEMAPGQGSHSASLVVSLLYGGGLEVLWLH